MQLGPFSPDSDGFVTSATLYSEVSVEASEQRGEPVCAYFVTSYPQPPPAFLGRRLVAEHGIVRAGLVERAGWGAA